MDVGLYSPPCFLGNNGDHIQTFIQFLNSFLNLLINLKILIRITLSLFEKMLLV